jgi:hypothetical protein
MHLPQAIPQRGIFLVSHGLTAETWVDLNLLFSGATHNGSRQRQISRQSRSGMPL